MKKGYKRAIAMLIIVLVCVIGYDFLIKNGIIRNYHIKDFKIDVNIENNGDIIVKEDTVYKFNGKYNGITITIPTNVSSEYYEKLTGDSMNDSKELPDSLYISNGIKNVRIYTIQDGVKKVFDKQDYARIGDSGVYTETMENGFTTYTIYEPSNCENKQFIIEYTLKDIIVQHNDVAELFWNFIGGEVECKIKNLQINVYAENIKESYTHGNSSGKIANTFNTVKAIYKNVRPHEFVSTRIVLNSFSNRINKQSNIDALPIIQEIEESYLDKKELAVNLNNAAIIMTIIVLSYWAFLLIKYEKEIELVPLVANDVDILDKYNPMIAACIAQNRGMHPRDILAVLIDLVNVKALKMVHIRASVIGGVKDTYKLTKNEEFFNDVEKSRKLDEIQKSVLDIFFNGNQTIELTQRLKEIKKESRAVTLLKHLDEKVSIILENIGANHIKVPKWLRIWNTFMFIIICIYILFMIGYNISLNFVTLSMSMSETFIWSFFSIELIVGIIVALFPIAILVIKCIVKLLDALRKGIAKLAFKLTNKKLTKTIMTIVIIFIMIFVFEIIVIKNANLVIATILFFAALLIVLTDNLMTSHDKAMQKEYVLLKILQDKIENGSMLEEKQIQDNILWNRYFTFAIALGVGDVAGYVKYIPDISSMEDVINDFYKLTDGYYGLYGLDRQIYTQARIDNFISILNKANKIYWRVAASGGSSGSGGFSSGGGRFSGGGGRGGGRGAF